MKLLAFLRKELGIKGKTIHSGRGFWMFHSAEPMTRAEFHALVDAKVGNWLDRGLLEQAISLDAESGERHEYRFTDAFKGNTRLGYFVPNDSDDAVTFLASVA